MGRYQAKIEELEAGEGAASKRAAEFAAMKAENAELKSELEALRMERDDRRAGVTDAGSARARALIERILAETHE